MKLKSALAKKDSNTSTDPNQLIYAMRDASNYGISAAMLQFHQKNKQNEFNICKFKSSRTTTQAELRLSTL